MKNEACGGKIIFENIEALDIGLTLDCGQAFRWVQKPNGAWHAVVDGRAVDIEQLGGTITVTGDSDEKFWRDYLDLDRDYAAICEKLKEDKWLNRAVT